MRARACCRNRGGMPTSHRCSAIPHVVVAVNKMDLVDYSEEVFDAHLRGFPRIRARSAPVRTSTSFRSARSKATTSSPTARARRGIAAGAAAHPRDGADRRERSATDMRFPVQYVIRPTLDFRGYAGQVASGVIRRGDRVMVLPSGRTSKVKSIVTFDGDLEEAYAPQSVTVCLEDEIDISRGDMLVKPSRMPHVSRRFEATVVWMAAEPLEVDRPYLVKHTSQQVRAQITTDSSSRQISTIFRRFRPSGLN